MEDVSLTVAVLQVLKDGLLDVLKADVVGDVFDRDDVGVVERSSTMEDGSSDFWLDDSSDDSPLCQIERHLFVV